MVCTDGFLDEGLIAKSCLSHLEHVMCLSCPVKATDSLFDCLPDITLLDADFSVMRDLEVLRQIISLVVDEFYITSDAVATLRLLSLHQQYPEG